MEISLKPAVYPLNVHGDGQDKTAMKTMEESMLVDAQLETKTNILIKVEILNKKS